MQNILGQWLASIKHYLYMCLLLSSPERLPCNPYCTALSIFSYYLIGLFLVDEQRGYASISSQVTLDLAILALIAYAGLRWKNSLSRFQQTFSALVGVNLVISICMIPIYDAIDNYQGSQQYLPLLVDLAFTIWILAVLSLIFKRAFETSTPLSAMISFNYFVVYQIIAAGFYS